MTDATIAFGKSLRPPRRAHARAPPRAARRPIQKRRERERKKHIKELLHETAKHSPMLALAAAPGTRKHGGHIHNADGGRPQCPHCAELLRQKVRGVGCGSTLAPVARVDFGEGRGCCLGRFGCAVG